MTYPYSAACLCQQDLQVGTASNLNCLMTMQVDALALMWTWYGPCKYQIYTYPNSMSIGFRAMVTKREIFSEHLCSTVRILFARSVYLPRPSHHLHACSLFAKKVLQFVKPGAIILGGDLVDAKTIQMQSHQYRQEWEVHPWAPLLHADSIQPTFQISSCMGA